MSLKMNHKESNEQQALFQWAKLMQGQHPDLKLLHAIGNGNARASAIQGARMKREGVLAGVSDIFLPVARSLWHGLYIELKVKGGRVSDNQKWWIVETTKRGYLAVVCYGWIEAKGVIEGYLGIGGIENGIISIAPTKDLARILPSRMVRRKDFRD